MRENVSPERALVGVMADGAQGLAEILEFQRFWRGKVLIVTYEGLSVVSRLECFDRQLVSDHETIAPVPQKDE